MKLNDIKASNTNPVYVNLIHRAEENKYDNFLWTGEDLYVFSSKSKCYWLNIYSAFHGSQLPSIKEIISDDWKVYSEGLCDIQTYVDYYRDQQIQLLVNRYDNQE